MFLKLKQDGALVEILSPEDLYDPFHEEVMGRIHDGQEMQDSEAFSKTELIFPSGESLPRCWIDGHYQDQMGSLSGASQSQR